MCDCFAWLAYSYITIPVLSFIFIYIFVCAFELFYYCRARVLTICIVFSRLDDVCSFCWCVLRFNKNKMYLLFRK